MHATHARGSRAPAAMKSTVLLCLRAGSRVCSGVFAHLDNSQQHADTDKAQAATAAFCLAFAFACALGRALPLGSTEAAQH
jgi:hypothetical protein